MVLLHMAQMDNVFVRLTVHRDAIRLIKYLPKSQVFISFCDEYDIKLWRLDNEEKRLIELEKFRLHRNIADIHVLLSND